METGLRRSSVDEREVGIEGRQGLRYHISSVAAARRIVGNHAVGFREDRAEYLPNTLSGA